MKNLLYICGMNTTTQTRELWMRESTEFTMSNGTTLNGFRICFVRNLNENESLDEIDESEEFMEVVGGSVIPDNVDEDYNPIDSDDIDDEDIEMFNPTFYIGDENGRPID